MAIAQCRVCGQGESIAFCSETGDAICAQCAVTCQVCEKPISRKRVQLTSTGRKLCSKCMAQRNARRKAKKQEMAREARKQAAPAAKPAPTSFEALQADAPPARAGTSFEDLMAGEPALAPVRPFDSDGGRDEADRVDAGAHDDDEKQVRLEGEPSERGGRLQLPPMDENRPILTGSGYQPPSRAAWVAAFTAFGIAGAIFWTVFPGLRDIMLPADLARPKFMSNLMPVATETNALRDAGNVKQFDILSQGPIFLAAWAVVLVYCLGFFLIILSTIRSMLSSYFAKRRLKRAEEYAEKYGQPYPQ